MKRRRRVKVEHDRSGPVERRGVKRRLWKNGKHITIKEMKSSKKDML